ncbi:hypothetical protein [Arcticibacter sp.]|uniref:hypothetical protein n=1 Tax=Arcticibacter sp. TaxID=1872630 RepID=UPI003890E158
MEDIKQSQNIWNATNDQTEKDEAQLKYDDLLATAHQPVSKHFPFVQWYFVALAVLLLIWLL